MTGLGGHLFRSTTCVLVLIVHAGRDATNLASQARSTNRSDSVVLTSDHWSRIGTVVEAPDGRLIVLEQSLPGAIILTRRGAEIRRIGRRGDGPGELLAPRAMGWRGDTLWIADRRLGRVSMFSYPSGTFLGSVQFRYYDGLYVVTPEYLLSDGSVLSTVGVPTRRLVDGEVVSRPVLKSTRQGLIQDTVAWSYVGMPSIRVDGSNGSGTTLVVRNPFALTGTVAVDPAGDAVYFLEPILPTRRGPWGARFSLTKTNASGDTVYSLALRNEGRELRRQDVDDVVAQIYSGLQASSRPLREAAFRKAFLERIQLPAAMRGYDAVVAGSDGWVWVRRATLSLAGGSAEWEVLDPDGVERGTVTVPAGGTVVLVTAVGAWLLGEDGFGIPFLKWTPINLADLPMP